MLDKGDKVGLLGPRRKRRSKEEEEVFLPCFGGRRTQQPCEVLGEARACSLHLGPGRRRLTEAADTG